MEVSLIFHAFSAKPIDDKLKNVVEEIEIKKPNLLVLAARQFRYSLHQTTVEISIKEPREFNVLEEFIIRAGLEFDPPLTEDELASILALDPIFVRSTAANLKKLQTLSSTSPITVTDEGRSFYEKGSVPQPPQSVQIYAIADSLGGNLSFQLEPLSDVLVKLPDLAEFIKISQKIPDIASFSVAEIQQSMQSSDLDFHTPEAGKIVTACKVVSPTKTIWKKISLFVIFDSLADKISIQIRGGKQIQSAAKWLDSLQAKNKISLSALCKSSNETIDFERESALKHKNVEIAARLAKINQNQNAVQLRDGQIATTCLEILNAATNQILIYLPWLNQTVVEPEFLNLLQKLANRGVWIIIGYGISPEQELISSEIAVKLRNIKTADNLPGIQLLYLGDSHIKEIIVDQKTYLWGFHNYLDYRGELLPTGESVYQMTTPQQVEEAYQFLVHRLQSQAEKLWNHAVENRDSQLAIEPLCVWGALGMEDTALKYIESHSWLELPPEWRNIIVRNLKSPKLPTDLT
ncbi:MULTISPECIES: hypothetical protein [unclassified Anabaena]|uniref:hypothetical protein n=1 Tax=unclassified Anabaena TaxID=2619674 RepID=UPI0039C65EFA